MQVCAFNVARHWDTDRVPLCALAKSETLDTTDSDTDSDSDSESNQGGKAKLLRVLRSRLPYSVPKEWSRRLKRGYNET